MSSGEYRLEIDERPTDPAPPFEDPHPSDRPFEIADSVDVTPLPSSGDHHNRRLSDPIERSDFSLLHDATVSQATDLPDFVFVKNSVFALGATDRGAPTLGFLVGHVFGVGAERQVAGVNARRIIASVKNVHPGRYVPEVKLPAHPVGRSGFPGYGVQSAVPESVDLTCPEPAFAVGTTRNLAPESLGVPRLAPVTPSCSARPGTKPATSGPWRKRSAALLARNHVSSDNHSRFGAQ